MTSNYKMNDTTGKQLFDRDEKDPLTVKGYTKIFELCENISDVFGSLKSLNKDFDINQLVGQLKSVNCQQTVQCIFSYCDEALKNESSLNSNDYIRIVETLSLLESVFRNVLLRPYISAYRTINTTCGRYRCYINSDAEHLFKIIGFKNITDSLFTYTETDMLKTVQYALTCTCFWYFFTSKLDQYNMRQNQSARRTGAK